MSMEDLASELRSLAKDAMKRAHALTMKDLRSAEAFFIDGKAEGYTKAAEMIELEVAAQQRAMSKSPNRGVGKCQKVEHGLIENGYLHGRDDDGPYTVDGINYCGRCHQYMDLPG